MKIERARKEHIDGIMHLLRQVLMVHHKGRPDLFRPHTTKYTPDELETMLGDDSRPIFVGVDEQGKVQGYAFCIMEQAEGHALVPVKTLYLDDLCVDEPCRGQHVGQQIYAYVLQFAREQGCYNLTLNVWDCNPAAQKFYAAQGLKPLKTYLEAIL